MRSRLPMGLMPLLLLALCSSAQAGDLQAKMDQYMQASVKVDHFMGAILVAQHGKVILAKGYGKANLKLGIPNTPDKCCRTTLANTSWRHISLSR